MRKAFLLATALTLAATTMGTAAGAATIVNLDGRANTSNNGANGVVLNLGAGIYEVNFVAGDYTAFTRWNSVQGCNSAGQLCRQGWENSARIVVNGVEHRFGDGDAAGGYGPKPAPELIYFSTAEASLAHAVDSYSLRFSLSAPGRC